MTSLAWFRAGSLCSFIAGLAPTAVASDDRIELLLRDGTRHVVRDFALAPGESVSVTPSGAAPPAIAWGDLVEIDLGARVARDLTPPMTLLLHDGSRLVGRVAAGDDEAVSFELAVGGTLELPLDAVRALLAGPRHADLALDRLVTPKSGDLLQRRQEVGGDSTRGTLVNLLPEAVRFEYSLGTANFAWSDIEAVVLEQQVDLAVSAGPQIEVDLVPDGTLRCELVRVNASEVVVRLPGASAETTLPRAAVTALRVHSDHWSWLSTLEPDSVREVPYLGGPDDFLFPWRRDRSVTGQPLRVHGRRYGRGIGCHARSELSFAIPPGTRRFVADAGLSDEVLELPERGAAEFRVLLDGVVKWRSTLVRGGDPAVRVPMVDVGDAKLLTLIVDFGAGEDVADRAVWGDAIFLR